MGAPFDTKGNDHGILSWSWIATLNPKLAGFVFKISREFLVGRVGCVESSSVLVPDGGPIWHCGAEGFFRAKGLCRPAVRVANHVLVSNASRIRHYGVLVRVANHVLVSNAGQIRHYGVLVRVANHILVSNAGQIRHYGVLVRVASQFLVSNAGRIRHYRLLVRAANHCWDFWFDT